MTNLRQTQNKSMCMIHRVWMITIMVVLCLCSTQIFAQTGVTIGDTSTSGNSMLNVNGNLAVGSSYYTTAAPANGMIVEGNVGIGTSSPGSFRLNVAGTMRFQNYSAASTNALLLTNTTGDVSKFDLSGSGSQYLRGDGTWGTPTGIGWAVSGSDMYATTTGRLTIGDGTATFFSSLKFLLDAATGEDPFRVRINTFTKFAINSDGGVGIGAFYNAASTPDNGLIVSGDATLNSRLSIGAGLLASTQLFVEAPTGNDMLRMRVNTVTKFLSATNGGTSIGSAGPAPTDGLYVQGAVRLNTLTSGLSTNLVTSDASGNLTKYAHGTSGQFLRGDGWQNISTIIPTGTVNQTLRHDGTSWVASNTILNLGTGAAVFGTTPDFTVGDQTDGSRGFKIGYTPSGSGSTASIISLQVRHTGAIMNWLRPMSFNDLTGTIGMGLTIGGSGFTAPIPTSQLLVSTDVPTAAQDGVGRFIFNGAGNNGTSYYGLTAVSDPTTSGARGIGVLASGDYYGLVATNPIGSTPLGAIKSEGNIDVTTGNVTVASGNITENGNAVMRWRGVLAAAPATDVQEGDMYFDSTSSDVFIRANSGWINLTP